MAYKSRIYCNEFDWTLAPGAGKNANFAIQSPGRQIKLRSITLDHYIAELATLYRVPPEQNNRVRLQLIIGAPAGPVFSSIFTPLGGLNATHSGNYFLISRPQQMIFDNFFISEVLPFQLILVNNDAALTFVNVISIMVETDEKIIYN